MSKTMEITAETSLIDELGLRDEYTLVKTVGKKSVYAHTIYYEIEEIDYDQYITEDNTPVDNLFSERQQRFFIQPLHIEKWTDRKFLACSNVAIYYQSKTPAVVPDMFLSFDVTSPETWFEKKDRCYFTWLFGKPPELVIEIVSNKIGGEDTEKMAIYANMKVLYYIVYDPYRYLYEDYLNIFILQTNGKYERYESTDYNYMPEIGLGIQVWEGFFEGDKAPWGRWCSKDGNYLLTGKESTEKEIKARQEAELRVEEELQARQEAELRAEEELQARQEAELRTKEAELRAEEENQARLKVEQEKAEMEAKMAKLLAQLEKMGLTPIE